MKSENTFDWEALLKEHEVKITSNRVQIIRTLSSMQHPVSMNELVQKLTIDKSGIFRTLNLFREHHLVHVIEGVDGQMLYEVCHSRQSWKDVDDDEHVHFYCQNCHRTYCLFDVPTPKVKLPDGFVRQHINFVVKGICPNCSNKLRKVLT